MAEGSGDVLKCSICLGEYQNPKRLACGHCFCEVCLNDYTKEKSGDDKVNCPLCRKRFELPVKPDGTDNTVHADLQERCLCEICGEKATKHCLQCEQIFCEKCITNVHERLKLTRGHIVKTITKKPIIKCELHPNMTFVCKECVAEYQNPTAEHVKDLEMLDALKLLDSQRGLAVFCDEEENYDVVSIVPVASDMFWIRIRYSTKLHLMNKEGKITMTIDVPGGCKSATADSNGNAMVCSTKCISYVTQKGKTKSIISVDSPEGVAYRKGEDGRDELFYTCKVSGLHRTLCRYDAKGKTPLENVEAHRTCGIAADKNSDVLCLDKGDSMIVFTQNGDIISTYNRGFLGMSSNGVCFDNQGCILIADKQNMQIFRTDKNSNLLQIVLDDLSDTPYSICVDNKNQLWIGFKDGKISVYRMH